MSALFRRSSALRDATISNRALRSPTPGFGTPAPSPLLLSASSARLLLGCSVRGSHHVCFSARGGLASDSVSSGLARRRLMIPLGYDSGSHARRLGHGRPSSIVQTRLYSENAKDDKSVSSHPQEPTSPPTSTPKSLTEAARLRTSSAKARLRNSLTSIATPRENIYNLPNFLTVTRLFAAPATAYLLLHDQHTLALALFAYAGITDLIDGWLARKWKLQTVAGSVMDPMADKALMIIVTVTLAVKGLLPAYLATLILGRDASLAVAAIYYRFASLPSPKTFVRYWDFSLPSAEVHPTTVSKYNTFLQLVLIGSTLALPVVTADSHHLGVMHDLGLGGVDLHQVMQGFQILVAATTVWSGLSYAYLKNAVTILGKDEVLKAKQGARGRAVIGATFGSVCLAALWMAVNIDDEEKRKENLDEASKVEGKRKTA